MVSLKFHDFILKSRNIEMFAQAISEWYEEDYTGKLEVICLKINYGNEGLYEHINIDKSTAIKLSKELRKQIALLD